MGRLLAGVLVLYAGWYMLAGFALFVGWLFGFESMPTWGEGSVWVRREKPWWRWRPKTKRAAAASQPQRSR